MKLGFKDRFIRMIKDGSKRHTIRAPRKDGKLPQVGEPFHMFERDRQPGMAKIAEYSCVRVERFLMISVAPGLAICPVCLKFTRCDEQARVFNHFEATPNASHLRSCDGSGEVGKIWPWNRQAFVDNVALDASESMLLAFNDGFRDGPLDSFADMLQFWSDRPMPWSGYIYHWNYTGEQIFRKDEATKKWILT